VGIRVPIGAEAMIEFVVEVGPDRVDGILAAAVGLGGIELPLEPVGPDDHREIRCQGVQVARVSADGDGWALVALRCIQPVHGCQGRWKDVERKLRDLIPEERRTKESDCQMCGGSGWLPAGGEQATFVASAAISMGAFRGILLSRDRFSAAELQKRLGLGAIGALVTPGALVQNGGDDNGA